MPYYSRSDEEDGKEFDEYNPTPYGGGYDMVVTYGRPLPPSESICYPSAEGEFDYERPAFSYAEPCAYSQDALQTEYGSYSRPSHAHATRRNQEESGQDQGRYGYGGSDSDQYGSGGGGRGRFESYGGGRNPPSTEFGSSYGRRSESESESEYGSGYAQKPAYGHEYERPAYGRSEGEDYRKPYAGSEDHATYGNRNPNRNKYDSDDNSENDNDEKRDDRHRHNNYKRYGEES